MKYYGNTNKLYCLIKYILLEVSTLKEEPRNAKAKARNQELGDKNSKVKGKVILGMEFESRDSKSQD